MTEIDSRFIASLSTSYLREPLAFVGHRLFDGLSMAAVADVGAIFSAEGTPGDEAGLGASSRPLQIRCLEALGIPRKQWSSADIGAVVERFGIDLQAWGTDRVVSYAASSELEALRPSDDTGQSPYCVASGLRELCESKHFAKHMFARLDLPQVEWHVAETAPSALISLEQGLGYPLVARAPSASNGSGTFLIESRDAMEKLLARGGNPSGDAWLFEPLVDGYSLNVNGVAFAGGTIAFPPSVQILGEPNCTASRFGFCGNDYSVARTLPLSVLSQATDQTERIGEALTRLGYRGAFGVDFLVGHDGISLPCEINPRFQSSTALLNFWLTSSPEASPGRLHLKSFRSPAPDTDLHAHSADGETMLSQLIVHTEEPAGKWTSRQGIPQGLYERRGARYALVRRTLDPSAIRPGTFLAVGTVGGADVRVAGGSALARLIFRGPVLEEHGLRLTRTAADAAAWVRQQVQLQAIELELSG